MRRKNPGCFFFGLFVFLTSPLLLLIRSKCRGNPYDSEQSPQILRHGFLMTVDVYCDHARLGGDSPEDSVLLIRERLSCGSPIS